MATVSGLMPWVQSSARHADFDSLLVFFAPTIIQGYGHSAIQTQLFPIPPYAVYSVFGMIISTISYRLRHRFTFAILGMVIGIIGFAVNFQIHDHTNVQYGALFLASAGTYTAMPLVLCWYALVVRKSTRERLHARENIASEGKPGGELLLWSQRSIRLVGCR